MTDQERMEALDRSLTNITPDAGQIDRIEALRTMAKALGFQIIDHCHDTRERSLALTHLEETVMWSVKAIVLERAG